MARMQKSQTAGSQLVPRQAAKPAPKLRAARSRAGQPEAVPDAVSVAASAAASGPKADGAFRSISEVSDALDVPKHVLRFWEGRFPHIRPMKRGGGRRLYRPEDVELLRGIRHLLHVAGYTIRGVQKLMRDEGIDAIKRAAAQGVLAPPAVGPAVAPVVLQPKRRRGRIEAAQRVLLEKVVEELRAVQQTLAAGPLGAGPGAHAARKRKAG